jgi:hypothetical protein
MNIGTEEGVLIGTRDGNTSDVAHTVRECTLCLPSCSYAMMILSFRAG